MDILFKNNNFIDIIKQSNQFNIVVNNNENSLICTSVFDMIKYGEKDFINKLISNFKDTNLIDFFNYVKYFFCYCYKLDKKPLDTPLKLFDIFDRYKDLPTFYFAHTFFYCFSYTNINKKDFLIKANSYLFNKIREINPVLVDGKLEKRDNKRIKILFLGTRFQVSYSSVFKDRSEIIKRLDNNIFDKHILFINLTNDMINNFPEDYKKDFNDMIKDVKIISLNYSYTRDIEKLYNKLIPLNLDIIVFPDIGMDPISNIIATLRMAPIQINSWGHSVTSGINNIDYFITSNYFETENAQDYYSEKLVKLNSLTTYYNKKEYDFLNKKDIGLPDNKRIIFCLQQIHKISYIFLQVVKEILDQVENSIIIFLNDYDKENKEKINNLLNNRGYFIPSCSNLFYNSYLYHSDIVLDTYPFGGCNSTFESFSKGKIVITRPSKFLSGRFTYGFYKKMNIYDPIVKNYDEYIKKTVFYLNNKKARIKLEKKILANNHLIFNEEESVVQWQQCLIDLHKKENPRFKLPEDNYNSKIILDEQVTILILTNRTHKSLKCLELLLKNINDNLPELRKCKKIICHDLSDKDTNEYFNLLDEVVDKYENTNFFINDRQFEYSDKKFKFKHWGINILKLITECKTPYFLFCEHDWIFTKRINISDIILKFMINPEINYVRFNKWIEKDPWDYFTSYNSEYNLTRTSGFCNHPYLSKTSIWLNDWIPKLLNTNIENVEANFMYELTSFKNLYTNYGLYIYGHIDDLPLVKHTDGRDEYENFDRGLDITEIDLLLKK